MSGKKAGFVAIVGRPSAGKSTLLNALCGWKVSIVSRTPQTTRNRIRGIVNADRGQLVFLDTPGYHEGERKLNLQLKRQAEAALADADAVLYVADCSRTPGDEESLVAGIVAPTAARTVVALNKVDEKKADPGAMEAFLRERLPGAFFARVSALKSEGLDVLLDRILDLVPEGEAFYPEEYGTDQEPEFRISEIVREKAFLHTREELPHSIYVEVSDASFNEAKTKLSVRAFLVVERDSQKGMLIGKGASMIKRIRQEAERDLADIFPYAVKLDLQVRVDKNWRQNDTVLRRLGIMD